MSDLFPYLIFAIVPWVVGLGLYLGNRRADRQEAREATSKALAAAMEKVHRVADFQPSLKYDELRRPDYWEQYSESVFAKAKSEGRPLNSSEDYLAAVKRYEPHLGEETSATLAVAMGLLAQQQRLAA